MLTCGPQKTLKTSISVDLAYSLATAGYFLGRFRVPEAVSVGLMSAESGLATLRETFIRVGYAAGHDPSTVRNLIIADRVPQFGHLDHLAAVERFILDNELMVLIVDPAYMALPGNDAANLFVFGQLLRSMSELCQKHGVALILCHHTKKSANLTSDPLELESIAWSGFAEFARQWIMLNRRAPYIPGSGSHNLWMAVGGSVGHGGLWGLDIEEGIYGDPGGRRWDVNILDTTEIKRTANDQKEAAKTAERQDKLDSDKRQLCVCDGEVS